MAKYQEGFFLDVRQFSFGMVIAGRYNIPGSEELALSAFHSKPLRWTMALRACLWGYSGLYHQYYHTRLSETNRPHI
jgi:hypothetical protein